MKPTLARPARPTRASAAPPWAAFVLVTNRDLKLDFARGLAIVVMAIDHLVGDSWLHALTLHRFYATAAEGFVCCSGFVLGQLSRRRVESGGERLAAVKALRRAAVLYACAVTLMACLGAVAIVAPGWAAPAFDAPPASFGGLVAAALTFRLAPPIIDVLPLYVLCLLLVPVLTGAMKRGLWLPLMAASVAAWAWNWFDPYALAGTPIDRGRPYFAFASWQLLFVASFALGWGRDAFRRAWAWAPPAGWAVTAIGITVGLGLACACDAQVGYWPEAMPDRASWLAATDRSLLGPVRLLAVAALFPLIYAAIDRWWRPLSRLLGRFLLPLGQNALYVYLTHVPVVVGWTVLVAPRLGGNAVLTTVLQAAVVYGLWLMVDQRVLWRWIPK